MLLGLVYHLLLQEQSLGVTFDQWVKANEGQSGIYRVLYSPELLSGAVATSLFDLDS